MESFKESISVISGEYLIKEGELVTDDRLSLAQKDVYSALNAIGGQDGVTTGKLLSVYPNDQKSLILEVLDGLINYGYVTLDVASDIIKINK